MGTLGIVVLVFLLFLLWRVFGFLSKADKNQNSPVNPRRHTIYHTPLVILGTIAGCGFIVAIVLPGVYVKGRIDGVAAGNAQKDERPAFKPANMRRDSCREGVAVYRNDTLMRVIVFINKKKLILEPGVHGPFTWFYFNELGTRDWRGLNQTPELIVEIQQKLVNIRDETDAPQTPHPSQKPKKHYDPEIERGSN